MNLPEPGPQLQSLRLALSLTPSELERLQRTYSDLDFAPLVARLSDAPTELGAIKSILLASGPGAAVEHIEQVVLQLRNRQEAQKRARQGGRGGR